MRNHFACSIVAAAVLAFAPLLLAQQPVAAGSKPTPRTADGKPDLSGVWTWIVGSGPGGRRRFTFEEPPLQPWAMEKFQANRAGRKSPDDPAPEQLNPSIFCFPSGVPKNMMGSVFPFEIFQSPNRILIFTEADNAVRQIRTDGRSHPAGFPAGYMGHSIGKWDGDTLVVDTIGRNDKTWIDIGGVPSSDALHIVERMRRTDQDHLEIDFSFDDPKAFTKPWGAKRLYRLNPDLELVEQIACEEYLKIGTFRVAHWPPEEGK